MNSRALVLDFDDTLYAEAGYFEKIFSSFCDTESWPASCYTEIINNFRHYRLTKKDIFNYFIETNFSFWADGARDNDLKIELHNKLFDLYTTIKTSLQPFKGVIDLMDRAAKDGIKLGILTNGVPAAQLNKWACLDLPHKSDGIFLPARTCAAEKPNPEAFNQMARLLGVSIKNTIFVGDQFEKDLAYPLNEGGWGILITDQINSQKDHPKLYYSRDVASLAPTLDLFIKSVQ